MDADTKEKPAAKGQARGLGKGLSALMGEIGEAVAYDPPKPGARERGSAARDGVTLSLALDVLVPSKVQPRDHFDQTALLELAESIRKNGVIQPIIVREARGGKYEIIAGERRWRAAGIAGQRSIPAIVRAFDDKKALEIALVENVQREGLNPLEEAAGYQRLMSEFKYTQEQLAGVVNKSRSHVANLLRLLELPEAIRLLLLENKLTMGHARSLASVPDALAIANDIVAKGLSVRQTEKLVRLGKKPSEYKLRKQQEREEAEKLAGLAAAQQPAQAQSPAPPLALQPQPAPQVAPVAPAHRDPDIMALEETLSENLGLKVSINDRGQSGEILIAYDSLEQLDEILRRLGGSI